MLAVHIVLAVLLAVIAVAASVAAYVALWLYKGLRGVDLFSLQFDIKELWAVKKARDAKQWPPPGF